VRAAIEAQQAIYHLNRQRVEENRRLEIENAARTSAGLEAKPLLPVLLLGSGINTGMATVGLMGSKNEQQNFTVFGREVNLASRLESASGRGRIYIGETTYQHLLRDDPELAARCKELPLELKGFRSAVKAYEVPWLPEGAPELETSSTPDGTSSTTLIEHPST
jgi:class 3 adenylate cyclase